MPIEIKMPQLSDTMTDGTLVKWHKKEGDKVKANDEIADVETDKATMPMEVFDAGTIAYLAAKEGEKVAVGGLLAVIATGTEDPQEIRKQFAGGKPPAVAKAPEPSAKPQAAVAPTAQPKTPPTAAPVAPKAAPAAGVSYNFDLVVIGGGPAGYAAAIRAGQIKKRVLCVEREKLGGTCLNWGCIPTKALLEDSSMVRRLRTEAAERGIGFDNLRVDFPKMVGRSRAIADKLSKGIAHLFGKYAVKSEAGTAQLVGPHRIRITSAGGAKEVTAEHIILAVGARATPLPGAPFDGQSIISSREAMILPKQPKSLAIVGAGAIGAEFADMYNALGTEVTLIEMLPHVLPIEDDDVSILLERIFARRGVKVCTGTKTEKVEKTPGGVRLTLSGQTTATVDAEVLLAAIGITANVEGLAAGECGLELFRNRVKVDPAYRTNLENVWAIGDCVAMMFPDGSPLAALRHPDLAHVAHHEAVNCVERIFGVTDHSIDYAAIPACTYTHPQVASLGATERKLRQEKRELRIGKFPFSASGRALAAGETDGFVKLIFDAQFGQILGVHMIGENVTELLGELVMAWKLEATEDEIIEAMHAHPTMSEAVMEAAGVPLTRAIHL